jgi:hypothetical protein
MKLTSAQVERTLTQFQGEAIPDNHPVIPQLNGLFGEHTFFLDSHGLNIVEPEAAGSGSQSAKVGNASVTVCHCGAGTATAGRSHTRAGRDLAADRERIRAGLVRRCERRFARRTLPSCVVCAAAFRSAGSVAA